MIGGQWRTKGLGLDGVSRGGVEDDGDDTLITDVFVDLVVDIGISARGWWLAWSGCSGETGIVSAVVPEWVVYFGN